MEKELQVEDQSIPTHSPPTSGPSVNWRLVSVPASRLSCSPGPPTSSAVHALQTKVKTFNQRRQRGREREREREKFDSVVPVFDPAGHTTSLVLPRERARCKGSVSLAAPPWRSSPLSKSSSSEVEEEVEEVQVKLEIHSPPPEAPGEPGSQAAMGRGEEKSERGGDQISGLSDHPRGLGEGASLENLTDNSSSGTDALPPPAPPTPASTSSSTLASATSTSSSPSSSTTRHWAPPKGFWRIVRPETLLLNGVPSSLPLRDYTQTAVVTEPQRKPSQTEASDLGNAVDDGEVPSQFKHSDSLECYLDRYEQKEAEPPKPVKGPLRVDSMDSESTQSGTLSHDEKAETSQRVCRRPKERRQHTSREEAEQSGVESSCHYSDEAFKVDCKGVHEFFDQASDSSIPPQELEQCPRSLIGITDELPLSPRHEQAKRLLERARLKARSKSNHIKGDRPARRSQSDQRCNTKRQSTGAATPASQHQTVAQLMAPLETDPSPADLGGQSQRPGCSPTRVRFEDESEKEAESRYLDRLRDRGRPEAPKTKNKAENNPDCNDSGSDRGRSQRSVSMPPALRQEDVAARCQVTMVIKEVIVLVKKCEACGSVVKEPASLPSEAQSTEPQQFSKAEETRGKSALRCGSPSKSEASTRPKATVTFAGAFVLGESKDSGSGWRNSEFGKLRRRSRKGESSLESGHGPYGPSWARRNSNPRSRANKRRAVSFAPGSPIAVEPHSLGGLKSSPAPLLPIKSALKSSSKNRSEGSNQYSPLTESQGQRGEVSKASSQGTPTTTSLVPCIRPSTLRYSQARLTPDLPSAELWDATPNRTGLILSDFGQRALALSRPEDLRAELLRSAHLKAEVHWEENSDGSRKLMAERDGRSKLSLRRFFSSIGLNSVGRLVKGARSSSMEQLSIPMAPRASSASPTRRPNPSIRIQRRPSLQTLHTVFPLAQLRKASSVQSLERRTERSTILGEVQLPYGLAPSPESPQMDEAVLPSRVVRPVGRVSQVFPDGTLLLELTRPPNGPFGFVISRGKGRPDTGKTGVYVEKVGEGAGEGLYVGLLGVGDEILQVNGEAVAGFTLDQVTRLLTRDSTAFIRIMPSRRNQR